MTEEQLLQEAQDAALDEPIDNLHPLFGDILTSFTRRKPGGKDERRTIGTREEDVGACEI